MSRTQPGGGLLDPPTDQEIADYIQALAGGDQAGDAIIPAPRRAGRHPYGGAR
ncbi:hypothetical protein [Thermobispora bispora]|uniref:hypothetical protein n=1 Tax=Thermobispora bispora TaxID=2006 RepID=UPI0019814967|nr:hypothetical protein [Thermobispora bispora]